MSRAEDRRRLRQAGQRRAPNKGGRRPAIRAGRENVVSEEKVVKKGQYGGKLTRRENGLYVARKELEDE